MIDNKRGQITIFIIVAIVIIAAIVLYFVLRGNISPIVDRISGAEVDVKGELDNCFVNNKVINEKINQILLQGGSINPRNYIWHEKNQVEYLCYSSEYLKTCYVQQPLLVQHIESEIAKAIRVDLQACVSSVANDLKSRGYEVNAGTINDISISIIPGRIDINTDYKITAKKRTTQSFENVKFMKPSKVYELIMLSTSIVNYESTYGDSEIMQYMVLYPNIKVEKLKIDESKIYVISERDSGEKFEFAVRSLVFPAGYNV